MRIFSQDNIKGLIVIEQLILARPFLEIIELLESDLDFPISIDRETL